jgi:hypothetical protein
VTSVLQSSAGRMIFGREAAVNDRYPDRATAAASENSEKE